MDELAPLALLLIGGLSFRFALTLTGQHWAQTYQQTVAFLILPFVTYIITKTISGNIALSLGMIGAMSIVRFRNPVKSALELVMYFALITLGISASVRTKWAIQLILIILGIIVGVKLVQTISKKFNKSFYNLSFNEGVSLHMIEIHSSEKIEMIEKSQNLKVIINQPNQNEFVYRLAFENKMQLELIKEQLETIKSIKKIDINYI
jgi:thiol:disulfide interchange protein|tara:strand:+ start:108 stop:725 length:618 start_codon:yes stop_codon:yes gene_type:complete